MQKAQNQQYQNRANRRSDDKNLNFGAVQIEINSQLQTRAEDQTPTLNHVQNRHFHSLKQKKQAISHKISHKAPVCRGCDGFLQAQAQFNTQYCQSCRNCKRQRRVTQPKKQSRELRVPSNGNQAKPSASIEPHKETDIWEAEIVPPLMFQNLYPFFCRNGLVAFPVEDSLFQQYRSFLQPFYLSLSPYVKQPLPDYFESLLEVWNALETFPEHFRNGIQKMQIFQTQQLILDDIQFLGLVSKLLDIFIKDFTCQKNDLMKRQKLCDYFSLLKFCSENGLMQKVYIRCWPSLFLTFMSVLCGDSIFEQNKLIVKELEILTEKSGNNFPADLKIRLKILAYITRMLAQTTQFRRIMAEKVDSDKKQHRKLAELEEKKKKIAKELSKLEEEERLLIKSQKSYEKGSKASSKNNSKKSQNNCARQIQYIRTRKAELLCNVEKVEEEIQAQQNCKNRLTNVELLGLDRDRNAYWSISTYPDKVFLNQKGRWSYISGQNLQNLINSLNLRGTRESNLHKMLSSFVGYERFQSEAKNFTPEHFQIKTSIVSQISISKLPPFESVLQQIKFLLAESEKKIANYLEERTSRWGSETERQQFVKVRLYSCH